MKYRGTIAYRSNLGGKVDEGFTASLVAAWDFLMKADRYEINTLPTQTEKESNYYFMRGLSCDLEDSANQIANGFLGDWVIFLDTDHVFASDALFEMIQTFEQENLDVLVGFTQKRQPPYTPILYKTDFDPLKNFDLIVPQGIDRQRIIQIDSSGLACLMVSRKVLDDIRTYGERPFDKRAKFYSPHLVTKELLNRIPDSELPKDRHPDERFWEDASFYWRVKMLGHSVFCAPWIKFYHLEQRIVDESMIHRDALIDPRIPTEHTADSHFIKLEKKI